MTLMKMVVVAPFVIVFWAIIVVLLGPLFIILLPLNLLGELLNMLFPNSAFGYSGEK